MSSWNTYYFEDRSGRCPIEGFLDGLKTNERAKALAWIAQLESEGPNLPRPYADLLEDGIHELRIRLSGNQVRILSFFCYQNAIVLTHAFVKTSARVPIREINTAKRYRDEFMSRHSSEDLKGDNDK